MGWTNSVPIFHEDVTYILREEIPEFTEPYIDDVPIRDLKHAMNYLMVAMKLSRKSRNTKVRVGAYG